MRQREPITRFGDMRGQASGRVHETLGAAIERVVLDSQFYDIEQEILENPGAIEPWLIRRRGEA